MVYDLTPLFGGPNANSAQPPSLASLWQTSVSTTNGLNIASALAGIPGLPPLAQHNPGVAPMYGAPPSLVDSLAPSAGKQVLNGYGKLTWLSSKAGLILCANNRTVSFQIKDFCDNLLTDLSTCLRVGFTLNFQATLSETGDYIANLVSPLYGADSDKIFANSPEANLDEVPPTTQPGNNKDAYSLRIEERAIPTLLSIFSRHAVPQIQLSSLIRSLSSLHSQMSSVSGSDDELFRYVGSSSLKRRQFIERRTHIFVLSSDDTITLQQPFIYSCVLRLASHLLRRGGVTAIESLYEFYMSPNMPLEIRNYVGDSRTRFIELMNQHQWIFSIFPNRTYVSVRRNLPHYDYPDFINTTFADCELFRPAYHSRAPHNMNGHNPASISGPARIGANSHGRPMNPMAGGGVQPISIMRHPGTPNGVGHNLVRPHALWSAEPTMNGGGADWFTQPTTWKPQPLMSALIQGTGAVKNDLTKSSRATQTEMEIFGFGGIGSGCTCACNCGARIPRQGNGPSRTSFSASPPSAASENHTPPIPASPAVNSIRLPTFEPPFRFEPTRFYDPFGLEGLGELFNHTSMQ